MSDVTAINFLKVYGKDIPFFLMNKPSRVKGDGDLI